jgi:hypothetical protein
MRLSQSHRLDYLMQVVPPGVPGVKEELQRFGGLLREEEVRTLGVNVYDPVQLEAMGVPAAAAAAVAARARLPSRMGGLGIVDTDYIHDAAYSCLSWCSRSSWTGW